MKLAICLTLSLYSVALACSASDTITDGGVPIVDASADAQPRIADATVRDAAVGDSGTPPDTVDRCPGFDDRLDEDHDGVPDGCDRCPGGDDQADIDGDGVPDHCDASRPHVLIIVSDDQGLGDVSINGAEFPTPALDRLAMEGAVFSRFYTQPVCTPTRVGLLTGYYPIDFGLMRTILWQWAEAGLPTDAQTLPEHLAAFGYRHRGIFGKWHLGQYRYSEHHPLNHGFTDFEGLYTGAASYFTQRVFGQRDWHVNFDESDRSGYTTNMIADAAIEFLDRTIPQLGPGEAFFAYVPFTAPHTPLQAEPDVLKRFEHIEDPNRRKYAAMVASLDHNVGRLLDALDERGIIDDTIVWFFSDNGGSVRNGADNAGLRDQKGTVYEGAIRTYSAIRYPPAIKAGTVVEEPVAYIDVVPTVLQGVGESASFAGDGLSTWDRLLGRQSAMLHRRLWFTVQQVGNRYENRHAVIDWPMKLVRIEDLKQDPPTVQHELFNLEDDPSESAPIDDPALTARLSQSIDRFLERLPPGGSLVGGSGSYPAPADWSAPTDWRMRP